MLGYVTALNAELKMKDFELYGGYYCGICKSVGKRYGQVPRLVLSYDAAFLALLLAALTGEEAGLSREHCVTHHIRKKTIVRCDAVDYAADVMVLLACYKLDDDVRDEGKIHHRAAAKLSGRYLKKAGNRRPELKKKIRAGLLELEWLERQQCASIDQVGDVFGRLMEALATGYFQPSSDSVENPVKTLPDGQLAALKQVGYHLGRWIYLMDAWDDVEKDIRSGAYNPLLLRFGYDKNEFKNESVEEFKARTKEDVERNLMTYLEKLGLAADLLEIKGNKDIIENVIYLGLRRRTDLILGNKSEQIGEKAINTN